MDDEESPLLGHRIANGGSEANFWKHLLLDRTSSPGTKSPNALVRLPAHFFNVFKITLLSCKHLPSLTLSHIMEVI